MKLRLSVEKKIQLALRNIILLITHKTMELKPSVRTDSEQMEKHNLSFCQKSRTLIQERVERYFKTRLYFRQKEKTQKPEAE